MKFYIQFYLRKLILEQKLKDIIVCVIKNNYVFGG